jgi:hypothetical protein
MKTKLYCIRWDSYPDSLKAANPEWKPIFNYVKNPDMTIRLFSREADAVRIIKKNGWKACNSFLYATIDLASGQSC